MSGAAQYKPARNVCTRAAGLGRGVCWSATLLSLGACSPAGAQPVGEADEVVVTAPSLEGTVQTTPHSISVISAADIARSTAASLPDLLAREANVNLQSFGTPKTSSIDLRGMGATAPNNVIVLIDGHRLNDNDLTGADLSAIPLSQVQRIEILRGGGAVRYGNGAVAGVINIITKQAQPGRWHLDMLGRYGSYATRDWRLDAGAGFGAFAGGVNLSKYDTNGYRQNSDVHASDGAVDLRWLSSKPTGLVEAYLKFARHEDTTGLPGGVSAQAFTSGSSARRASTAPFDRSSTVDDRYTLGATADFGRAGSLELKGGYRDRRNPFVIGFTPLLSLQDQQWKVVSRPWDFTARYDKHFEAGGYSHSASAGVDLQGGDFARYENGEAVLGNSRRLLGDANSKAVYAETMLRGPAGLALNAGVRFNRFETDQQEQAYTQACQSGFQTVLVDVDPGPGVVLVPVNIPVQFNCTNAYRTQRSQSGTWNNRAFELGLTWEARKWLTAFASASSNFRNPNFDELILASGNLHPQKGRTYELGLRASPRTELEVSATGFYMTIEDEINFGIDPQTGLSVNRNFDQPTRRIGLELEAHWRPFGPLVVRGNFGYVSAKFTESGAYIPLVPRITANAELEWSLHKRVQWLFSAHYVGRRFDGDDFTNRQFPELAAYVVCDTALRFQRDGMQLSAGINNVFNEVYSTIGYSATYYPMPERNYYVELRWRF